MKRACSFFLRGLALFSHCLPVLCVSLSVEVSLYEADDVRFYFQ